MRKFEKISEEQFIKDIDDPLIKSTDLYNEIQIPVRSTVKSAGYDICAVGSHTIEPGEVVRIPTGLKVKMKSDEVLLLMIRSSLGYKYQLSLPNSVGVIDSDYYNNQDNEGHFWILIRNNSESPYTVNNGDRVCQGIFVNFLTTSDDSVTSTRQGGFGSTGI